MGVSPSVRTWVHPLVLEQWPGTGHAPAVAEGPSFTPQGCWHRGSCLSRCPPAAHLSYRMAARDRAALGPSSSCSDGGSSQGGKFGGHRGTLRIIIRAVRWYGEQGCRTGGRLCGGVTPTLWTLQCEPGSSLMPLPPGVQQLLCHAWGWQRGCWSWWICA